VKVLLWEKYLDQTKHEMVKIKYLRDLIRDGIMVVECMVLQTTRQKPTTDLMAADGLTKALSRHKFDTFVRQMGVWDFVGPVILASRGARQ
jgi:hypothetical protein